jgi:hypothetical protein|uniref:Uncharacterized protein n=1 Tax=viral metagenome TaxID=1070528 RepID=A0A6C0H4L5_9ZZZZ
MDYSDETQFQPKLICAKGDIVLSEIKIPSSNNKAYNLKFEINNLNTSKVNIDTLLSTAIYDLLEKVNVELIEKIYILDVINAHETDICILLKQIAKEVGLKQKYVLFRTTKYSNNLNNNITFYNKDLIYEHKHLITDYLKSINLNIEKYEPMTFNFGKTHITLNDEQWVDNLEKLISVKFSIDFQLTIEDDLPIYMNNFIGLMFKKMFYNVKMFLVNLNS